MNHHKQIAAGRLKLGNSGRMLRLTRTGSGLALEKELDAKRSMMRLRDQLLRLFEALRGVFFWRVVFLLLVLATAPSCKPSKTQTDLDMVGAYSLSKNTPISLLDEFDYVGRVSAIVLRPDHTFSVTNFPVLEGGSRWTSGALISTNGQWTITTQTKKNEWGMGQYIVHKLALQIPGLDDLEGHISRWGVEVQFLVDGSGSRGPVSYQRTD